MSTPRDPSPPPASAPDPWPASKQANQSGVPAVDPALPTATAPADDGSDRPRRGCAGSLGALVSVLIGAVYVANPTAGVDLLPDFIPLFGNLDEAAATTMLVLGIQYLFGKGRRD